MQRTFEDTLRFGGQAVRLADADMLDGQQCAAQVGVNLLRAWAGALAEHGHPLLLTVTEQMQEDGTPALPIHASVPPYSCMALAHETVQHVSGQAVGNSLIELQGD